MFLESDPILWISSETFFKFVSRRFAELLNLQKLFALQRPLNYGTISTLLIHLMRYVMVTPHVTHGFLAKALRDLRFEEIMMSFGAFFLQELDAERGLLADIQEEDDLEVQQIYGKAIHNIGQKKEKTSKYSSLALTKHALRKEYPWGTSIPWKLLEELLSTVPDQFLLPVDFDENSLHLQESRFLFMQFSGEIWLSAHSHYLKGGRLPECHTLQDAINLWTINGLKTFVTDFIILPSGNGLSGCPPRHVYSQQSFEDRMSIYFPARSVVSLQQTALWKHYSHHMAYLDVYHTYLKEFDVDKRSLLDSDLRLIFSHLQCLPTASGDKKPHIIWQAHQNKLKFIANSRYYQILEIGQPVQSLIQTTHKAQLPGTVVKRRLYEEK